jgi:ribonucleoside-diphosphate reductase alpha chain/ribonucleoside-triphosphate reductase
MSNNSIVYDTGHKPTKAELENIFGNIMHNGEPGFFNLGAAKLRRPNVCGINPCAEILLDDRGVCNLSTVVLSSFLKEDRSGFDLVRLTEAMKLAVRIGKRQTNVELSVPEWSEVQKRDRLTGVSLTGVMDSLDALEWNAAMSESLFALLADVANMEATEFASEMRIPRPLLVTAIKPEGTLSQLPTVSSGMHRAFAPYFIRRIRVSANDPVCHALKYLGVPNEPDASKPDRIVFSFPVKSATPIAAAEESALSQLSRYYMLQENYTDHNSSCTLTFAEDEVPGLIDEIHANWDKTIAIALLPKTPGIYPQMPYEAIPAKAYYEMMNSFPNIDGLAELVDKFERGEMEDELEADPACGTGQCPIR